MHDAPIKRVMKESIVKDAIRLDACEGSDAKDLAALREIYRLLNHHRQVIKLKCSSAPSESMPAPGARTLKRYHSESQKDEQARS